MLNLVQHATYALPQPETIPVGLQSPTTALTCACPGTFSCSMHRDIKPENVLFTKSMQLKLADFGLALDMREERAVTRAGEADRGGGSAQYVSGGHRQNQGGGGNHHSTHTPPLLLHLLQLFLCVVLLKSPAALRKASVYLNAPVITSL